MSDDTPTERFDPVGDAPTERIGTAETETVSEEVVEERKSRKLMIILGSVGGALLLAVIILLVLLLTRGDGAPVTPSASPTPSTTPTPSATATTTPSATPTPTPTPTPTETAAPPPPPPPPPPPVVESYFVSDDDVDCSSGDPVPLSFSWDTNGASVTFAVGTQYAESGAYQTGLPATGGIDIDYQCGQSGGGQIYSIAVIDGGGGVIGRETIEVRED